MAGLGVRLYTDEMTPPDLAQALRRQGYDALSCHDAGLSNKGIPDEAQLAHATQDSRAILTFNTRDFLRLDAQWKAAGRRHGGVIIVARRLAFGHLIRCVARHLDTVPPSAQSDALLCRDTSPTV